MSNKAVRVYKKHKYAVFPINPKYNTIEGLKSYRSLDEIPVHVDTVSVYVNPDIGMKLVHVLMVQDVRHVAQSRDLHPWICETARNYLGTAGC